MYVYIYVYIEEKQSAVLHQQKIESLQKDLVRLQAEHRTEMKKLHQYNSEVPMRHGSAKLQNKNLDKTRRKLASLVTYLSCYASIKYHLACYKNNNDLDSLPASCIEQG